MPSTQMNRIVRRLRGETHNSSKQLAEKMLKKQKHAPAAGEDENVSFEDAVRFSGEINSASIPDHEDDILIDCSGPLTGMVIVQNSAAYYEEEDFASPEEASDFFFNENNHQEQHKTKHSAFDNSHCCTHKIISLCDSIGAPLYF